MMEEFFAAMATISFLALVFLALKYRCRAGLDRPRTRLHKAENALAARGNQI